MCEAVHESCDSLGRWLPWCHPGYGPADARQRIDACLAGWRSGELFSFAVCDTRGGRLLGSAGLSQHNRMHRCANAGYWIRRSAQRQGLAAAALAAVARFGFEQLGLIRVEVVVEAANVASQRTAERAGARFEALARNKLRVRGEPRDARVYALVPGDLADRAATDTVATVQATAGPVTTDPREPG
jgi:RimJ/RimL family protein N-acetyltransferase